MKPKRKTLAKGKAKRPDKNKNYSMREALNYTRIESRETLKKYLLRYKNAHWAVGRFWIKQVGRGKGETSIRYIINGSWLSEFNKRYNAGRLDVFSFSIKAEEEKYSLDEIRTYCESRGILTIAEFVIAKKNEEKNLIEERQE